MKGDPHVSFPFSILGLVIGLSLIPSSATAQTLCSPRDDIISQLAKKHSEAPVAIGITTTGGLLEVLATPGGETWTLILSNADGMSCLITSGEGWRSMDRTQPEEPGA